MLDVSIGCVGQDTYGVSCTFCGKCGRKWTSHGVDDSEVVKIKVDEYKRSMSYDEVKKMIEILK